jgi:hypothetical protein
MGRVGDRVCKNHKVGLWVHGREPHARPHFHVRCGGEWKASYALDTFRTAGVFEELARSGNPHPSDLREALENAERLIDELYAEWERCNARD